jgi:hypothetical protein
MALDAHVADGAGGTRRLTLARCSYHPDRLAPDPAAVTDFAAWTKPGFARRSPSREGTGTL